MAEEFKDVFNSPEFQEALDEIIAEHLIENLASEHFDELLSLLDNPVDGSSPGLQRLGRPQVAIKKVPDEFDPNAYSVVVDYRQKVIGKPERINVTLYRVPLKFDFKTGDVNVGDVEPD